MTWQILHKSKMRRKFVLSTLVGNITSQYGLGTTVSRSISTFACDGLCRALLTFGSEERSLFVPLYHAFDLYP